MNKEVKHIAYMGGRILDAEGCLVAFFDEDNLLLHINGVKIPFKVIDLEHAMDLVAEYA